MKFGWVIHLRDAQDSRSFLKEYHSKFADDFGVSISSSDLLDFESVRLLDLPKIKSTEGPETEGSIFLCPLLPQQVILEKEKTVAFLEKILEINRIRQSEIVCLGGLLGEYVNLLTKKANDLGLKITSGKSGTAAVVTNSIINIIEGRKKNKFKKPKIGIFGAKSVLGQICAEIFKKQFYEVFNFDDLARNRLEEREYLLAQLDYFLVASPDFFNSINYRLINNKTVVCDAIPPYETAKKIYSIRKDLFVYEGAQVSHFYCEDKKTDRLFNSIFLGTNFYACIAEVIGLCFENIYENFSLNDNLSPLQCRKIFKIIKKHGFDISYGLSSKNYTFSQIMDLLQ